MSMIVNNLLASTTWPPEYIEDSTGIILKFKDAYELQDFILEIRMRGVQYGLDIAKHRLDRKVQYE